MKETFIEAIHSQRKVKLTFFSKEDGCNLVRTCAPMDHGPSRRSNVRDRSDRYHLWDYDSDTKTHTLSLLPQQVISIDIADSSFSPSEFVTWSPNWFIKRDWGALS